jgi:acyl-CoA thioester hydrolase
MLTLRRTCPGTWVDFNGHMRDAYYLLLISFANDQMMAELGTGPDYLRRTGCTFYNLDTHIRYLKEAHHGDPLRVEMRLLDADDRRVHLHSVIFHDETNAPLAVNETLLLHVDQIGPQAAAFPDDVAALVEARAAGDAGPAPSLRAGHVGIRRKTGLP